MPAEAEAEAEAEAAAEAEAEVEAEAEAETAEGAAASPTASSKLSAFKNVIARVAAVNAMSAVKLSAFQSLLAREARYLETLERLCTLYINKIELNDAPWKGGFNSDPNVVLLFTTIKGILTLTRTLSQRIAALGGVSAGGGGGSGNCGNDKDARLADSDRGGALAAAALAAQAPRIPSPEAAAALGAVYESNATLFQRYLTLYTISTNVQDRLDRLTLGSPDFIAFQISVQQRQPGTPTFEEYLGRPILHVTTYAQALSNLKSELLRSSSSSSGGGGGGGSGGGGDGDAASTGACGGGTSALDGALAMFSDVIDGLARAKDEILQRRRIELLVSEKFSGKPKLVEKGRRLVFEGPLEKVSRNRTHE
jgi:hypothetical protein